VLTTVAYRVTVGSLIVSLQACETLTFDNRLLIRCVIMVLKAQIFVTRKVSAMWLLFVWYVPPFLTFLTLPVPTVVCDPRNMRLAAAQRRCWRFNSSRTLRWPWTRCKEWQSNGRALKSSVFGAGAVGGRPVCDICNCKAWVAGCLEGVHNCARNIYVLHFRKPTCQCEIWFWKVGWAVNSILDTKNKIIVWCN